MSDNECRKGQYPYIQIDTMLITEAKSDLDLITFGLVVKNGRHRYQANSRNAEARAEQHQAEKTAAEVMDEAQEGGSKTIADVLDEMQRRLKSKPQTVKNLDEKLKALTRLYEMTDQPLKSLLLEIMTDLEAINKNG